MTVGHFTNKETESFVHHQIENALFLEKSAVAEQKPGSPSKSKAELVASDTEIPQQADNRADAFDPRESHPALLNLPERVDGRLAFLFFLLFRHHDPIPQELPRDGAGKGIE